MPRNKFITNFRLRLQADVSRKRNATDRDKTLFTEHRTKLLRALNKFCQLQSTYTPSAIQLSNERDARLSTPILAEQINLYLPSQLPEDHWHGNLMTQLIDIEKKLWEGQCQSSLDNLRGKLLVKSRMLTYRAMNVRNQGSLMQSKNLIKRNKNGISLQTIKY